jgi:hypothetical protein
MKPVAFETFSEQKCLSDYVASSTTDENGAQSLSKLNFLIKYARGYFQNRGNSISTTGLEVSIWVQSAAGRGLTCKISHPRQWRMKVAG